MSQTSAAGASGPRAFDLAQVNVAVPREARLSAHFADFIAALAPVYALAEASPGFVWRFQDPGGAPVSLLRLAGQEVVFNMSTWESPEALAAFTYRSAHAEILRERQRWFLPMKEDHAALWWVPAGHRPTVEEAGERIDGLRRLGPTPSAFGFRHLFPAPG